MLRDCFVGTSALLAMTEVRELILLRTLSLDVSREENITNAFICTQSVLDICDIIEKHVTDNLVLFKVAPSSLYDESDYRPFSLERIATNAHVPFSRIDSGTIVLTKESLKPFLSGFDHCNLFAIDIEDKWNESDVISQVVTCLEHDWRTEQLLLPKLPASQNFFHSHDDCYLTIQTHNPSFVMRIFARALQIYAETALAETSKIQLDVPEIPKDILMSFREENFGLTISRETTEVEKHSIRMGVAKKSFSFREQAEYAPEFWIRYELSSRQWLIEN